MAWDEKLVLALNSAFSAIIIMCNLTSEIRETFHARFVQIQRNYSLISRVYHLITYYYHRWRITIAIVDFWRVYPGFIASIGELQALKSLQLKCGLTSECS